MGTWHNIRAVIGRELRIMRNRPVYFLGSVAVIAFCAIFYLTFFKDGLPNELPIGVVDYDHSSLSRNLSRQLDATQLGKVYHFDTFSEARLEMQRGNLTGILVLPEGLYSDVTASRQPEISYYLNGLYFVGGALAYKDLLTMINMYNGGVKREAFRLRGYNEGAIMNMIQPIKVDTHQIGNAYTNYGYYLTNILLPAVLEMIVILVLIYSLGTELKYGTSRHLLATSGGSIITALAGKLIVYTILFSAIGLILILLLYDWMHFPIYGSVWNMLIAIILMVIASEGVAIFILGCLPVPRLALSIGALYSILGFSMSGFTLPIEALPAWIQGLAVAFPIRHYYLFYVHEVIFGSGFAGWWQEAIHMMLFAFLPLAVLPRLSNAYRFQNFPKE